MRTQNGQCPCTKNEENEATLTKPLHPKEADLLSYLRYHGVDDLINSLKMIHDFALYHTDLCFDTEEKQALLDLKILWQGLEQLETS
jgi:hypothetical protein